MQTLPDQTLAVSSQPAHNPEPNPYPYKPARWQPTPARSNLSLANYSARICQSTTVKAVASMALTISMGYWLTTTADAGSPDQPCDDCPNPTDLGTFKTRLPSQEVSTQTDIAPASRATAQFAPAPVDPPVSDFAQTVNAKLQRISAANRLSGANSGNVSSVPVRLSAPASPSSVYQPLLSLRADPIELPPPPLVPASAQGKTLNEQSSEPIARQVAHPSQPEQSAHLSQQGQSAHLSRSEQVTHLSQPEQSVHLSQPEQSAHLSQRGQSAHLSRSEQVAHLSQQGQSVRLSQPEQSTPLSQSEQSAHLSRPEQAAPLSQSEQVASLSQPEQSTPLSQSEQLAHLSQPEQAAHLSQSEQSAPLSQPEQSAPLFEPEESAPLPEPEQAAHPSQQEGPKLLATVTTPVRSEPQPAFSASRPLTASLDANQPKPLPASVFSQSSPSDSNTKALTLQEFLKLSSLSSADDQDQSAQARLQHRLTRLPLDQYHQYWQRVNNLTTQTTQAPPTFGFVDFGKKLVVLPESAPLGAESDPEVAINPYE